MPLAELPSSPLFNTFQYPSLIAQTAIRKHQYRPYRTPSEPVSVSVLDDIVSSILTLENIPQGYFLPPTRQRGPQVRKTKCKRDYIPQQQQQQVINKASIRSAQPEIHVQAPSPTSLSRWQSLSSNASTIKPSSISRRPSPITVHNTIGVGEKSLARDESSPSDNCQSSSDEDERVQTPISTPMRSAPCSEDADVPQTPVNIPMTPLDIPVDWDDLRNRWEFSCPDDAGTVHLVDLPDFIDISESATTTNECNPSSVSDYLSIPIMTPSPLLDEEDWLSHFELAQDRDQAHEIPTSTSTKSDLLKMETKPSAFITHIETRRPSAVKKKRHGRLLSLDEQELVLKTVRFSDTLDPLFNYTKFRGAEDVEAQPRVQAGQSFFSFPSPISPSSRRWTQLEIFGSFSVDN